MSTDGRAIANYIIAFCRENNREITNLSLQKIVYFCHVWCLVILEKPLIRHNFEAWKHGPVLQYLYQQFKSFDRNSIDRLATKIDPITGEQVVVDYKFDADIEGLLYKVVDIYSRMTAGELVELSHERGAPWYKVWNHQGRINPGMKIDDVEIARFYSEVPTPFSLQ